jgi:hypothetical protein
VEWFLRTSPCNLQGTKSNSKPCDVLEGEGTAALIDEEVRRGC